MFRRLTVGLAAIALAGCAGQKAEQKPEQAQQQPAQTQEKISNIFAFDLYNCFPKKVDVPAPANNIGLTALWAAAQPQVQECLINPASRGPGTDTKVEVEMSVDQNGPSYKVGGQNLSPAGQQCIQNALMGAGKVTPLEAGAPAAMAKVGAEHIVGRSPAVQFGLNDVSDIAGAIRMGTEQWCSCFQPFATQPPEDLTADITVKASGDANKPDMGTVTFDQTKLGAAGKQVAACLQPKIAALPFHIHSQQVGLKYPFVLLNSAIDQALPTTAPASARALQLDGIRAQKQANTAMALAVRANKVKAYDHAVQLWRSDPPRAKHKKHGGLTIQQLVDQCQQLVKSDGSWQQTLTDQLAIDNTTLDLTKELAAKDPSWNQAVRLQQKHVSQDQEDIQRAGQVAKKDEGICPKVHY